MKAITPQREGASVSVPAAISRPRLARPGNGALRVPGYRTPATLRDADVYQVCTTSSVMLQTVPSKVSHVTGRGARAAAAASVHTHPRLTPTSPQTLIASRGYYPRDTHFEVPELHGCSLGALIWAPHSAARCQNVLACSESTSMLGAPADVCSPAVVQRHTVGSFHSSY